MGPSGYQGPWGPLGSTGPDGPIGPTGPPGTIPGPDGLTGPEGSTGNQGPDNPDGVRGPIGPVGPAGETGYGYYQSYGIAFFGDGSNGSVSFTSNTTLQAHVMATTIVVYSNTTVELNGYALMATQYITIHGKVRGTYHERDNVTADTPLANYTVGQCASAFVASCSLPVYLAKPSKNTTCFVGGHGGGNATRATCTDTKRPTDPMSLLGGLRDGRVWGGGTEGTGSNGGGRGGGIAIVFAPAVNGTGQIDCSGEAGRDATGPIPEDAPSGGGGGLAVVMSSQLDFTTVTVNVSGGRGGIGWSYGLDGEAGSSGQFVHWICK